MTLHKIILENFKSYKGTHTIGPFDPFSFIVGLNGSGKSNLMDAVCFALTVSSSFLRANNLLDIINKDSTQAYVELYIQNTTNKENDPTANTKEYTILKRTINNKGLSNYYIDSKSVSYTDYLAFLHSINIYPKSKNYLIFQGEVDSISLKEPKEITKLVEEISGSVKYKKEYEAKEEKMNLLFAECQKMFEKRKEMNSRLKEIAEGKENEKKFKEKIRMKDELYAKVKLCELKEKVENMHKTEKCIEDINKRREDVRNKIKCMKVDDDNSNLKVIKEMMEIENDIENLMYEIKEASKKEIDSQVSKGNAEHIKKRIEFANDARVKKSKRKEIIKKEIDNAQKMYENEMRQIEKKYKKIVIDDAVKDKYFELENVYQNKAKELIEKIEENKLEVKPIKDKIKMLELNNKDLKANLQRYKDEIQTVKVEVDNAEYKIKISDANINVIRNKQSGSLNAFEKIANEENDLNNRLATCIKEILAIKSIQKESEKKLRINDCIEHLKLNFAGVHGKVVDLVTVTQKKYETAVSVLMSGFDQAVIVDNDKVAIKCIEYVKEQKIGRITFLPLSVLKQKEIDYNYRKDCIMAVDTVNCDKTIQKAVSFVLGNSLIAKDINEAKDLLYTRNRKTKICTLDGVLFHKNGNITGGRIENKFTDSNLSKFLAQKNDIMNKLQNIKIKKSAYSHVEAASEKIAALEKDNTDLLRYIEQEKTKLKFLQEKIDKFESTIHENASEIAKLEKTICSKTNMIDELETELQNIETFVFKDFIYAKNLKDFKDLLFNSDNVISNAGKEIKKMIDRLKNELETLETEVRGIAENLQLLNIQLELATQTGGATQQTKALNDILDRKRNDLTKIKSNFKASKVKMDKVKTELQKLSNQMSALDTDACEQSKKLARIRDDVVGIVKMSMIEEVVFPSKSNNLDDQNLFTIEMSEETILKNIGQIDFDSIKEDIDFYTNKYQQIVKDIEDTMPMSKLKDASKSQTNYGKINSDYDELRKEALIAKEEFNTVKNKRIDAFMSCYNVISQSIGDIYRQLTKREDVEGNAYLLLENNTEPYKDGLKYFTMPPSKRYREMQALSGGEKTMAALALLFAIHAYKPAPFYLFDEMDSALDKMNVSSIVDYIASTNVQFIIITLKPSFFQHSDGLIGIYKSNNTSKVLTYRFE